MALENKQYTLLSGAIVQGAGRVKLTRAETGDPTYMDALSWTIETETNAADVEFLEHRINEYNFATTGITDGRTLALFERDAEGQILAGLYGWT